MTDNATTDNAANATNDKVSTARADETRYDHAAHIGIAQATVGAQRPRCLRALSPVRKQHPRRNAGQGGQTQVEKQNRAENTDRKSPMAPPRPDSFAPRNSSSDFKVPPPEMYRNVRKCTEMYVFFGPHLGYKQFGRRAPKSKPNLEIRWAKDGYELNTVGSHPKMHGDEAFEPLA